MHSTARSRRLILLHLCKKKAPGGRKPSTQKKTMSQCKRNPSAAADLGRIRLLVRGMHFCLLFAARHTWIFSFVTQSATSQGLGVSVPSKILLISLYSCRFRAGKKALGLSQCLKDLTWLLFSRVKHFLANCESQV